MLIKNKQKTTTVRSKAAAVRRTTPAPLAGASMEKGSWKESRPAMVARAKKLVKDPNYPSAKVLNAVARLLVRHLT